MFKANDLVKFNGYMQRHKPKYGTPRLTIGKNYTVISFTQMSFGAWVEIKNDIGTAQNYRAEQFELATQDVQKTAGYMGDVNGPGCEPDVR